jgi:hypothetical protein
VDGIINGDDGLELGMCAEIGRYSDKPNGPMSTLWRDRWLNRQCAPRREIDTPFTLPNTRCLYYTDATMTATRSSFDASFSSLYTDVLIEHFPRRNLSIAIKKS